MIKLKVALLIVTFFGLSGPSNADTPDRTIGGDVIRIGETNAPLNAARDVFAAGVTVSLDGAIAQDAHAAGFEVDVDASTGGDLYAVGASVRLNGPVSGDLSASGFIIRTGRTAQVDGNARLAGGRVTIDGPVKGALLAAGGKVILNSEVSGNAMLTGETVEFGPDARIGGTLTYSAPERINIPEGVLPSDRIVFEPYQRSEMMKTAHETWSDLEYPLRPTFLSIFNGFLVTVGFFVLIGGLFLTFAPKQVRHLRHRINARPGMALLTGVIGLSVLFGLVPVIAMTVVGIPLVPMVLLVAVAAWILGYILGAYVLAMRALQGLGGAEDPEIWMRLLALVIGVMAMAILNFIPFLGWMANFALVLLGIGGMTTVIFERLIKNASPATDGDK
jgi:cytoskeletal protein CcmA (bactofilin family)